MIDSASYEFFFICNNLNPDLSKWEFLQSKTNVHLFIRANIGLDFQGWNEALHLPISSLCQKIIHPETVTPDSTQLHSLFDKFVFLNATVYGPYLPLYVDKNWVECFTSKLSDEVKITGISVNFMYGYYNHYISQAIKSAYGFAPNNHAHIQSMAFSLDRQGLDILLNMGSSFQENNFPLTNKNLFTPPRLECQVSSEMRRNRCIFIC